MKLFDQYGVSKRLRTYCSGNKCWRTYCSGNKCLSTSCSRLLIHFQVLLSLKFYVRAHHENSVNVGNSQNKPGQNSYRFPSYSSSLILTGFHLAPVVAECVGFGDGWSCI